MTIQFCRNVLKIKKTANTPQGFVRQMKRLGPNGDWRLDVSYKTTRKPKYWIQCEDYDCYHEAKSLKKLLLEIKVEASDILAELDD